MIPEQNRRQKVFTRAALRLCGGALCLCRRGLILNFDKNTNGLLCFIFPFGVSWYFVWGAKPTKAPPWRRDCTRHTSVCVPTDVVAKLMRPLFKHGYNVTCDNFFTSLGLAVRLAKEKYSIVGTIRQNRREQPQAAKAKQQLHESTLLKTTTSSTSVTLTCYQSKKAKSVTILSTLHPDVEVSSENNTKQKPETNNKTKVGVDVVDQTGKVIFCKSSKRKVACTVRVFYNVIDVATINGWVLSKETCRSKISRSKKIFVCCTSTFNLNTDNYYD